MATEESVILNRVCCAEVELEALRGRCEALEHIVEIWAHHLEDCPTGSLCTCGLDAAHTAALAGGEPARPTREQLLANLEAAQTAIAAYVTEPDEPVGEPARPHQAWVEEGQYDAAYVGEPANEGLTCEAKYAGMKCYKPRGHEGLHVDGNRIDQFLTESDEPVEPTRPNQREK